MLQAFTFEGATHAERVELVSNDYEVSIANSALARTLSRPLNVLRRLAPSEISDLKESFPDFAEFIDEATGEGVKLGGGPPNARLIWKTWGKGLAKLEGEFAQKLPRIQRRLSYADTTELTSEIVAAVSGSALLGLLIDANATAGASTLRICAAIFTLLGTLSALLARYFRRSPGGGSLVENYINLTKLAAEAKTLQVEIKAWAQAGGEDAAKDDQLTARASRVLTEMQALLSRI